MSEFEPNIAELRETMVADNIRQCLRAAAEVASLPGGSDRNWDDCIQREV